MIIPNSHPLPNLCSLLSLIAKSLFSPVHALSALAHLCTNQRLTVYSPRYTHRHTPPTKADNQPATSSGTSHAPPTISST